ncbi:solute:sodium symporter family transporter [Heyndrickxia ginsengihumi]|uniref:solute:sodium symporter family transporter n=1 Tax=Heyndrickxia ginsengihumi TaxID=363870 RepID=UPI003D196600
METFTILSFVFVLALVAFLTYRKMRGFNRSESKGSYFLGGRSLTGGVIGASLLLTNLSATNFVGMSAQSFSGNMTNMAYEVTSGICLVIIAFLLVPRYLKQGITTIPDFLADRFDPQVKGFVSFLFLISFVFNMIPITLYSGAIAITRMFHIQEIFGISYQTSIWITVWCIGIIGFFYAIVGGLKAVAISDTFNGIGLAIGGLLVPFFGILALGKGHFGAGFHHFISATPEKFNAIGSNTDVVPFGAALTGLILVNFYYWGTDQSIIQRALAAKDLKEGQKGVLLAGFFKVLTPLVVVIPGIIAFQLFGGKTSNPDLMYTQLVNKVLPAPLVGVFAAVMFGSVLSVFNGVINSTATLFALNVYEPLFGKGKTDQEIVRKGKRFGFLLGIISLFIAPLIMYAPEGLFQYVQVVSGFFNVPIFTVIFMGYVTKRVPAIAAKVSLVFFVGTYAILQLIIKPEMSFLYQEAILFVISCVIMLVIGKIKPRKTAYVLPTKNVVDIEPWAHRFEAGGVIIFMVMASYILCSKLGFAGENGLTGMTALAILIAALISFIGVVFFKRRDRKNKAVIESTHEVTIK